MYLTFRGPCIVIYSYNKSQQDALFLKFISIKNSTCFGQIYCYIIRSLNTVYTAIGVCHASYVDWLLARSGCSILTSLAVLCTQCWDSWGWTVDLSETCRVLYRNKFEKQCISLTFIIRMLMYFYSVNKKKYNVAGLCTFRNENTTFFENLSRPTV